MTSRNLLDKIGPEVDRAIDAHDLGDDATWMCGMFVMPTPDGQAAMNGYLSISISSPIVGEPGPTATAILDPKILLDPRECDTIVADLLYRAREMRSQQINDAHNALAATNPQATDFDFSQLLKK